MVIAIKISQGVIFDCQFIIYGGFPVLGNLYTCQPNVHASESGSVLEDVRGNHLEVMSNRDVYSLYIFRQDLTFIPKDIGKFFPNLKGIYYQNSNLSTISSDDLKPFTQLLAFEVYLGNLVSLDGNLFQHNINLQYISFSSNKIEHIGHNLLGGLNQLQMADFSRNICVSMYASGSEEIRELKEQLPILCPPNEVDECSDQLLVCSNENSNLLLENENLSKSNEKANDRIIELEMLVRELLASTCS